MKGAEKLVYLAGPISGLIFDDANNWRKYTQERFRPPVVGLSPLRCKQSLTDRGKLDAMGYCDNPLITPAGITSRDRFDCQRADMVLFNFLWSDHVSIGTCIEIGWADSVRRPMVAVMEPGNPHEHAIVTATIPFIVRTLDDAIDIIHAILLP